MPTSKKQPKIDPELLRQIDAAVAETKPVEAVLMLRQNPSQIAAHPERTKELTQEILKRVEDRVGSGAKQVHVFQNIGSFILAAEPQFLRELMAQPEIASALANRQPDQAKMPSMEIPSIEMPATRKKMPLRTARRAAGPGARSAKGAAGKR